MFSPYSRLFILYKKVYLADLKSGRCSSTVNVRLLRFWEARNVKRGGDLMWLDLLFVDKNSTMMQAIIHAGRLPAFRSRLTAGERYSVTGFDVARCAQNYRLSDSSLLMRFSDDTVLVHLTEPEPVLPLEFFRFRNQSELIGLANTNTHLPDLIGELTAVKSTVSDPPQDKNHVKVTIKLDDDASVTLSLFDAQAIAFHNRLGSMNPDPRVIVATSINPKLVGGRLFINATSGTHIYFDKETNAGEAIFHKLVAVTTGVSPAVPLLRGYAKVEPSTIAELNSFVVTAPSQEIDFICHGRVTRVDMDKGWCYVACSKCSKKLQRTVAAFTCERCNNDAAVGVLRYRVELTISDETAEGAFVCFDGVMTKLHNLRAGEAGQMLAGEGVNPEDTQIPPFITDMEGKKYSFQVRVGSYNFTSNHQTFTITRILSEDDRFPVPAFVNDAPDGDDGDDAMGSKGMTAEVDNGGSSGSVPPGDAHSEKLKTPPSSLSKKLRVV